MEKYRKQSHRKTHPKIVIWTHSEKTEFEYFREYKEYLESPLLVIKKHVCWEPFDLVGKMVEWKSNDDNFNDADGDQIWCVFDVDDFFKNHKEKMLDAIKLAIKNGIKIAYSNECFELWFILHFDSHNSPIKRGGDMETKINTYFKKNKLGTFKKNMRVFKTLLPYQSEAITNAQKIYPISKVNDWEHLLSGRANPSTSMHLLVQEIIRLLT